MSRLSNWLSNFSEVDKMDVITYKVITLGMYGVGKTCLLIRATQKDAEFSGSYKCTIGVDFRTK